MVQFINQYTLNAKLVKENLFNKHNHRILPVYSLWVFLMFVAVIRFAFSQKVVWLALTVLFLILMAITTRFKNINVLKDWRKAKKRYAQKYPEIVVEIGEVIAYTQNNKTRIYSWNDYEMFTETDHLLIMIMNDSSRLLIHKKAFTTGSLPACQKVLKNKQPKSALSIKR